MKVWVCYKSWAYEGSSQPIAAFDSEQKAIDWVEKNQSRNSVGMEDCEFEELEVE